MVCDARFDVRLYFTDVPSGLVMTRAGQKKGSNNQIDYMMVLVFGRWLSGLFAASRKDEMRAGAHN